MTTALKTDSLKRLSGSTALHAVILALWPHFASGKGLSLADTLYALGNYQYFGQIGGFWELATFLANGAGFVLSRLPGGDSVLGMQVYSSLLMSAFLEAMYFLLRDIFGRRKTFLGLFIAASFAWCPSVILYNRLTYMLFTLGTVLLVKAVAEGDEGKAAKLFLLSGILFGLNVSVRIPNVPEALMILVLAFDDVKRRLKDLMICIGGWAAGFALPALLMVISYGPFSCAAMVSTLFTMQEGGAEDYTASSMFSGILFSYRDAIVYLIPLIAVMAAVVLVSRHLINRGRYGRISCFVLGFAGMALWIRFAWGRGMFDFHYYHYNAIYLWGVLFTIMTVGLAVWTLTDRREGKLLKAFAFAVLLTILLTPVGSNNALYPVVDNMFLTCPFAVRTAMVLLGRKRLTAVYPALLACFSSVLFMLFIQGSLFHMNFALQDGYWGEERSFFTVKNDRSRGVATIEENARLIDDMTELSERYGLSGKTGIFYGNIPGLSYLLDIRSAITTIWPSLDTYSPAEFERDLSSVSGELPVVFISASCPKNKKYEALSAYMDENDYEKIYEDNGIAVYMEGSPD